MSGERFRVDVRLRNNRLIEAREQLGMSQTAAALAMGVGKEVLCGLETFRLRALGDNGWTSTAIKISDFYGLGLEYLWSKEAREVVKSVGVSKIDTFSGQLIGAEEVIEREQLRGAVREAVRTLPPRARRLLERRFIEDLTLEECGQAFDVSRERVRQIETKALGKVKTSLERAKAVEK